MPMVGYTYLRILDELELRQSWAGRTLAKSAVTGRRWATGTTIPESAAIILRLMQAGLISRADVEEAKNGKVAPRSPARSVKRRRAPPKSQAADSSSGPAVLDEPSEQS